MFLEELSYIVNEDYSDALLNIINMLPDYWYHEAASSTGKYHPDYALGEGGLLRHSKAAMRIGLELLEEKNGKKSCANVDYYSGFIYDMLNIPRDLFIPIFACARIVGWVAHDIETLLYCNKIVRPATKYVGEEIDNYK